MDVAKKKHEMLGKNSIARFALVGILLLGAIMATHFFGSEEENKLADAKQDGDTPKVSVPQMDTAIPAKTETATFSLG